MRPRASEWPRQGYRFPAGANAQNRLSASTASAAIPPARSVLSRQKRSGSCRPDGSRRRTWSARSSNRPLSPSDPRIRRHPRRQAGRSCWITWVLRIYRIAQGNPPIMANGVHAAWTSRAIRHWNTLKVSAAPTYHKLPVMRSAATTPPRRSSFAVACPRAFICDGCALGHRSGAAARPSCWHR
jgi:hypothetical protein